MADKKAALVAEVVEAKGTCSAGHRTGDVIDLDCLVPGGLCGTFYHNIFPNIQTLEGGGKMPWWGSGDEFYASCPDTANLVTLRVRKRKG